MMVDNVYCCCGSVFMSKLWGVSKFKLYVSCNMKITLVHIVIDLCFNLDVNMLKV
jgi:hypothetical protein